MISVLKGDITGLDFDIIVNPANTQLLPGSGINRKIFEKAGRGLVNEMLSHGQISMGKAVMSDAYNLPCKKVIHAAGPVYNFNLDEEEELLAACYWNSLSLAYDYMLENHLNRLTVAFPEISTGPYGFPAEEACHIAVKTVKKLFRLYPEAEGIHVVFVLRDQLPYLLYKKELSR